MEVYRGDVSPSVVLSGALREPLDEVIVIGIKNGAIEYIASSFADIEKNKTTLTDVADRMANWEYDHAGS